MANKEKGLSNVQLELLRVFNHSLSDEDLLEVKRVLANHFAAKASDAMDEVWDRNGLEPGDMNSWTNGHERAENRP